MALHRKREEANPAATRLLLVATEPVELPEAEVDKAGATVEREEFRQYLPDLFEELRLGGEVTPAPLVQSESLFIVTGETRVFWVRLWHTDETRTVIARLHVVNCLPLTPANIQIKLGGLTF